MIDRVVPVTEDELHALVDGELAHDRQHEVEAWLATHPEDAARVAAWRAQAESLRARFGGVADEPIPAKLNLDRLVRESRPWTKIAAAAAIVAFLLGGAAGWLGRAAWESGTAATPVAKSMVTDALDAHRLYIAEVRHPIEVPADARHLVPWLSKRLAHPLRPPELATFGLKLIGGRLLPGPNSPVALFMYEGASGERFTLYCARTKKPATALHYQEAGQFAAFFWVESDIMYVVSGPSERARLQKVAQSAYEQLESRPPPRDRTEGQATSSVR